MSGFFRLSEIILDQLLVLLIALFELHVVGDLHRTWQPSPLPRRDGGFPLALGSFERRSLLFHEFIESLDLFANLGSLRQLVALSLLAGRDFDGWFVAVVEQREE